VLTLAAAERLLGRQLRESATGCWIFNGRRLASGYGVLPNGRYAHRVVFGAIPDAHVVASLCGVAGCVRPSHHVAVTRSEVGHLRTARQVTCVRGHPLDPASANVHIDRAGRRVCRECSKLRTRRSKARLGKAA